MYAGNGEQRRTQRIGWLRAAVLGANDDILSASTLVLGVAAAHAIHPQHFGRRGGRPGCWGHVDGCR